MSLTGTDVYLGTGSVITQVNTSSLSVTNTFDVPYSEVSLALSNSGDTLYALQVGQAGANATVGVFREDMLQPTRDVYTSSPAFWLTVSPDGKTLYEAGGLNIPGIQSISLRTGTLEKTFLSRYLVTSMALSPDGGTLYAVGPNGALGSQPDYLWVVKTATGAVKQITLPYEVFLNGTGLTLALSPDGSTLAINAPLEPVLIFNTGTGKLNGEINAVGGGAIVIDPTGTLVHFQTTGSAPAAVAVANLATLAIQTTIPVAGAAIAFSPTLPVVYICDGTAAISVVSTSTYQVENSIPVITGNGQALAVTPDGSYLYADGAYLSASPRGAIIDTATLAIQPFFGVNAIAIH